MSNQDGANAKLIQERRNATHQQLRLGAAVFWHGVAGHESTAASEPSLEEDTEAKIWRIENIEECE